jgi:hypothetical protein
MIIDSHNLKLKQPEIKKTKSLVSFNSHNMNVNNGFNIFTYDTHFKKNKAGTHNMKRTTFWQEMDKQYNRSGNKDGSWEGIKDAWKNKICIAIGNSRALQGFDFNLLNDYNTIGCNHLVEDWDKMKWHIVQDDRFFEKTTYTFDKFKGKRLLHNSIVLKQEENMYFFKSTINPSLSPVEGIYSRRLTGISVLHFAIISGAKKIYVLGIDYPQIVDKNISKHYKKDYTGSVNSIESLNQVNKKTEDLINNPFIQSHKDKIINVCDNGFIKCFTTISMQEFKNRLENKTL